MRDNGDTQDQQDVGGRHPDEGIVALVVGDAQEDWLLPDEAFVRAGLRMVRASGFDEAQDRCSAVGPDLVFMPLTLDGKFTLRHLQTCLSRSPQPVVVVVATNDQINTAAEAMRLGAYDCLFKPFSLSRLARTIEGALKQLTKAPPPPRPATRTSRPPAPRNQSGPGAGSAEPAGPQGGISRLHLARRGFVASSPQMSAVLEAASVVAASEATVFISGDVGTGKTALAGIVHELSPRAHLPMVTVTCATLALEEFEAQFMGPDGVLARASGGTVYLDEIAELPIDVQPKVVRLVETAETGAQGPGIRVIASTGHDPYDALRSGLIRPELFYRLHVAPIELPPLRARGGDPALIARVRLAEFSEAEGRSFTGFSESALALISNYAWPGNLRELINVIRTVVLMNEGPLVTPDLLPPEIRAQLRPAGPAPVHDDPAATAAPAEGPARLVGKTLAEIERIVIEATIAAENGSVPRAARVLDVSPSTLYRKREAWAKQPGS